MANLTDLLNKINFTPQEVKTVSDAMGNLLSTINSKASEGKIPTSINFFTYGSISRKTKIKPLDDVDILYVIGKAQKKVGENMHTITQCSYEFTSSDYEPNSNISSIILLNKIRNAIKETYSKSEVKKDKEVVNVYLDSYGVGFDIAPAFDITNENYYLIAAANGTHYWKRTNPFTGNSLIENANRKINGHLINTLKILKYWFMKKKIVSPASYHFECVLANYFNSITFDIPNLFSSIYAALYNINYNSYLKSCPDPFSSSATLTSNLTDSDISKIEEEAKYARELLLDNPIDEFVKYIDPVVE